MDEPHELVIMNNSKSFPEEGRRHDPDSYELTRLGKKPVLKVNFHRRSCGLLKFVKGPSVIGG